MSDAGDSDAESAPPAPNGQAVPAAQAQAQAQHPLWQRAAGQGGPALAAKPKKAGTTTVNGRFVPISMAALELRARNEFDGASSVGGASRGERGGRKRTHGEAEGEEEEEGPRDYDDDAHEPRPARRGREPALDEAEADDDEHEDERSEAASGADVVAGAAFGGARPRAKPKDRSRALSVASDTDDGRSITSSEQRSAHRRAFPITGVHCVGCALPAKVTPVDDFVRSSCDKMNELALFKMAALIYQQKVAEPALAEDVAVPGWGWKDIRAHYTMHRMDPRMQRFENMRTLAGMRKTLELQLLREDESSGEHVLDKGNAEQIMKIITLQSKEITLLHEATAASASKNAGSQPPPGAASKRRGDR